MARRAPKAVLPPSGVAGRPIRAHTPEAPVPKRPAKAVPAPQTAATRAAGATTAASKAAQVRATEPRPPPGSILAALADPNLFAPHFKGASWDKWRAFLAALFALPMSGDELAAYRACTGRTASPTEPFDEAALIVGRRGGKSRVLATIAVYLATFRSYEEHLAPGEVATVIVIAADRKQARSIFRFVSGLIKGVPLLAPMVVSETNDTIELSNRVNIEIGTASFRVTRGYSFAAVLCDEIAFWRTDEASANPDTEILRALRPGMAGIPGSMLLLASTPYGKVGELYRTYRRDYGKDGAPVLVWKAPTLMMHATPRLVRWRERDVEADPEAARAEWDAEFRDDLADFVTRETIDAVTCWGRRELPSQQGVAYRAFVDPSGGANDSFTLAVAHMRDGAVGVLDAVLEIRPPFDPDSAVAECAALLNRFGVSRVVGDRYAGEWPVSRFAAHGIAFEQSAKPKSDLYHDLLPLVNARRVELLDYQRLSSQLCALERRVSRAGRDSIDHAPGGHDDLANCVAGVLVGLDLDRRPALIKREDLMVSDQPSPLPASVNAIYAVLAASKDGQAAVVYTALPVPLQERAELLMIGCDVGPIRNDLFMTISDRLAGFANQTCVRGSMGVLAAEAVCIQASRSGHPFHALPPEIVLSEDLLMPAATNISSGRVRFCAEACGPNSPLVAALDFRAGDKPDDPLRTAALWAIGAALDGRQRA